MKFIFSFRSVARIWRYAMKHFIWQRTHLYRIWALAQTIQRLVEYLIDVFKWTFSLVLSLITHGEQELNTEIVFPN